MFSKDKAKSQPGNPMPEKTMPVAPPPVKARPNKGASMPSIVSDGMALTGNLVSEGDVQIDGMVEGDIRVRSLTVGGTGKVKGTVFAEEVNVSGHVEGEISARNVIIARTAHVVGDIVHDVLSIESGAEFQGRCQRRPVAELDAQGATAINKPLVSKVNPEPDHPTPKIAGQG
jgi:cytoskeletal protein CcmA (bactofilin family)